MKTRLILGALALTLSTSAFAADVTGKWTAQVPGRDGQTRETTFNFTAAGEKLTGTVSGRNGDNPIADGVVKGDDLSFSVSVNFGGNDMKLLYKGKVAGEEIKFTRTRQGGDQPGQEFTAKRAK
jgi:opacity protein-like surface antigen